jgi:hypothetical protein
VWLGKADPVITMETARGEDPELMVFQALISAWLNALGFNNPITSGALKAYAERKANGGGQSRLAYPDLHQALLDASAWRGDIDPRRLGSYLARHQDKISRGVKLVGSDDKKLKQKQWAFINGSGT